MKPKILGKAVTKRINYFASRCRFLEELKVLYKGKYQCYSVMSICANSLSAGLHINDVL